MDHIYISTIFILTHLYKKYPFTLQLAHFLAKTSIKMCIVTSTHIYIALSQWLLNLSDEDTIFHAQQ